MMQSASPAGRVVAAMGALTKETFLRADLERFFWASSSMSWGELVAGFGGRKGTRGEKAYVADVNADGFTGWADFAGGLEDVEAAAAAEVDDCFALGYISRSFLY